MSSEANDAHVKTRVLVLAAVLTLLPATVGPLQVKPACAQQGTALANPEADNTPSGALSDTQARDARRRQALRKVALASLAIILILIICIVTIMIFSRRMRIRYLSYYRKIKFNRIWDVWWQKSGKTPDDTDKPTDR